MIRARAITWLNVPWLLAIASLAGAGEPGDAQRPPAPAIPAFRRIYISPEQVAKGNWTSGLLPIDAREFQRLLDTAQANAAGAPNGRTAQIEKAEYTAQLVGEDLLLGSSVTQIVRDSDEPTLLVLDACSPALGAATWQNQKSKPAVLGTTPQGRVCVLVEGSQLRYDWSQRGERTASGAVNFRLEFPSCPMALMSLELPSGVDLLSDQGIVSKGATTSSGKVRWTIDLGGHHRANVRIIREDAARERRPLTLLRQSLTYEFSSRGINVSAQLRLDIHGEALQRIGVDLDPSLRLVAARYGELELPWSVTNDVETRMSHVVLQLPEPIVGTGRVLQLSALAPLTTDKHWRLPGLQLEGMSWQEGTATLLVPNSLLLEQLITEGCRQSRLTALPAPLRGDSIEIQYYRPGATIDVLLGQPRERLKAESGALVEVGASEIASHSAVEISLTRGDRFAAQTTVNPAWTIDAVEALGSNRVVDWELEEQQSKPAQLKFRLENPISVNSSARLLIRGHRPLPAEPAFESQQLEMLAFDQFQSGARLISVRAADGYELRWTGSEDLNRRDTLKLTPAELQLFPQPPNGVLFAVDAVFSQSVVTLERRKPNYAADIRIDVAVKKDVLTETYTIQCTPESARVERLLVQFSAAHQAPMEWSLAGGNSGQLSARRIVPVPGEPPDQHESNEQWELNLRLVRPGPFELRAVRSLPFQQETPLALASIAEAATQRGTLTIRALGDSGLTIKNRRLSSSPPELLEADRYQTVRATFHYQPSRDDLGSEPAVSIAPAAAAQAESGAWSWNSQLDSRYAVDGTCVHVATFRIQTAGQQQIRLTMPSGAKLQTAWLDDQRLPLVAGATDEPDLLIDLPAGRGFATLSLYYSTTGTLPSLVASSRPAFPELDIPVVARQWSVWLPPGYEIVDTDPRFPTNSRPPLSWTERLFGVLGRGSQSRLFNPLAARDWSQLPGAGAEIQASRQACEQLAQNLGNFVLDHVNGDGESELTWGQLLALCSEAEAKTRRALLVDAPSAARSGITPQTRVGFLPGDTALDRGIALLRQANLVLLTQSGVTLITSLPTASGYANQLSNAPNGVMAAMLAGPLSEDLRHVLAGQSGSHFDTIESWRASPELGQLPWSVPELASPEANQTRGWTAYTFQLSPGSEPHIRIVHAAAMHSLGLAIFLAVVAIGLWTVPRSPVGLVLLCTLAGSAALVLPASYVPLASSAFLAGLFCLALRLIRIPQRRAPVNDRSFGSRSRSSIPRQIATLLLAGAILQTGAALDASQPNLARPASPAPTAPSSTAPAVKPAGAPATDPSAVPEAENAAREPAPAPFQILVPIDGEQKAGDKYYVPEALYNQLYRQAASASGQPKGWLMTHPIYQGALSRDPVHKQLGLLRLKVGLDLRVFQSNTTVRLPFPREVAAHPVSQARLDGRSIPVVWNSGGDELMIGVLAAGQYRLELDFQPLMQTDSTTAGFDLAIPPLANAVLELKVPHDAPTIELPTARGQSELHKDQDEIRAQLGASNRLAVRWPVGIGTEAAPPNLEVEELLWVKVRPGTTVLHAKFKYHVLAGRVRQIRLLTDPRLRLLPTIDAQSPVTAVHTLPGDPQKIDLELSRAVSDQVVIELSFLLTGTSGVGNLRLPRLESSGARATKRWLAVSVDPALQHKEQAGEDSKPIDVADYATAWGNADSRPLAAYSIPRGEPMWVLATQPNEPETSVDQKLAVSFAKSSLFVQLDAKISTAVEGYVFQLGLRAPAGLAIENVSLLDDNIQRVARWSMDEDGRITVFLTAPVTGERQLSLRGRLDLPDTNVFAVPDIQWIDAKVKLSQLQLFRQPPVLAEIQPSPGITRLDSVLTAPPGFGTLLGSYSIDDPKASLSVKLSSNKPKSRAVAVTSLQRDADRWIAEMEYHLEVQEGLVDALQFEIPPQWTEPYRLDPAAPFKIVSLPGEARRQMIVYPDQAVHDKFHLKIRGRVALSAGDRLRVPELLPIRIQQLERFVVLPQHLDLQLVTWETIGLSRAPLPAGFVMHGPNAQSLLSYQVVGEHFQATLKAVQRAGASALVALADFHVMWQADGNCEGVARFDLQPGGATSCVLEMPAESNLVHVSLEGLPAMLTALEGHRWRLGLGPQQLPQRIEVIYTAPLAGSASHWHFAAPRLADLQIERTMWTISGPAQAGTGRSSSSNLSVTAAQQEMFRLQTLASLVQLPAEVVGEHLPEEILRWYRPWRKRYAGSRVALDRELISARQFSTEAEELLEARELDKQIKAIDARLSFPTPQVRQASRDDAATDLLMPPRANLLPAQFMASGNLPELEVYYPETASESRGHQWASGLAIVVLGALAAFFLRSRPLPSLAPGIVVGVIGLAWWLLLAPSIVGLLLALAACWPLLYARWQPATR